MPSISVMFHTAVIISKEEDAIADGDAIQNTKLLCGPLIVKDIGKKVNKKCMEFENSNFFALITLNKINRGIE